MADSNILLQRTAPTYYSNILLQQVQEAGHPGTGCGHAAQSAGVLIVSHCFYASVAVRMYSEDLVSMFVFFQVSWFSHHLSHACLLSISYRSPFHLPSISYLRLSYLCPIYVSSISVISIFISNHLVLMSDGTQSVICLCAVFGISISVLVAEKECTYMMHEVCG